MGDQDDDKPAGGEPTPSEPSFNPEVPPAVDAPSLAPAAQASAPAAAAAAPEPKVDPAPPRRNRSAAWPQRRTLLAASIVLAAGIGGVLGAYATASWISSRPAQPDVAGIEERKALQQSIAHLTKQVATLKADLDKSNKLAVEKFNKLAAEMASKPGVSPVAKTADRVDNGKSGDITGSIPAPSIGAPPAAPATAVVPIPTPRPATRVAVAPARPVVLQDWWIYDARGGYIFVAGHGEIYQATPGAPLPGLGPVQSIRREDGSWVVVTPKGLIVAERDRRRFE